MVTLLVLLFVFLLNLLLCVLVLSLLLLLLCLFFSVTFFDSFSIFNCLLWDIDLLSGGCKFITDHSVLINGCVTIVRADRLCHNRLLVFNLITVIVLVMAGGLNTFVRHFLSFFHHFVYKLVLFFFELVRFFCILCSGTPMSALVCLCTLVCLFGIVDRFLRQCSKRLQRSG